MSKYIMMTCYLCTYCVVKVNTCDVRIRIVTLSLILIKSE